MSRKTKRKPGYIDPEYAKIVSGALKNCIDAHGPITEFWIGSATKRVVKQLTKVNHSLQSTRTINNMKQLQREKSIAEEAAKAIPEGFEVVPSDILGNILEQALDGVWLGSDEAYQWAMERAVGRE